MRTENASGECQNTSNSHPIISRYSPKISRTGANIITRKTTTLTTILLFTLSLLVYQLRAEGNGKGTDNFIYLPLVVRPDDGACYFTELRDETGNPRGGIILEPEVLPLVDDWVLETEKAGFTGAGYIRWHGADQFAAPGLGRVVFPLQVFTPGTYQFRMHNLHDHPDQTMENDMWVRLDSGPWYKVFSHDGGLADWNWETRFDLGGGPPFLAPEFPNVTAGLHTLEIAGRSHNFRLNRMALYRGSEVIDGKDLTLPASECLPAE